MVEEEVIAVNERITRNWERLEAIASAGRDIEKLKDSLTKIEKVSTSVPPDDLNRALSKLEDYLTKIEEKTDKDRQPPADTKEIEGPKEEDRAEESENTPHEGATGTSEDETAVHEEEKEKEAAQEVETADQEKEGGAHTVQEGLVGPHEPQIQKEEQKSSDQTDEKKPLKEETKEEEPQEAEVEAPGETTDLGDGAKKSTRETTAEKEDIEEGGAVEKKTEEGSKDENLVLINEIEEMEEEARSIGGETGTIQPHIRAMKDALSVNDLPMFEQYYNISKDWLSQYLSGLIPAAMNEMMEELQEKKAEYQKKKLGQRLDKLMPEVTHLLKKMNMSDIEVQREALREMRTALEKIRKDSILISKDIAKDAREKISKISGMLDRVENEEKRNLFSERFEEIEEITEENALELYQTISELLMDITDETAKKEKKKFEKLQGSIEPIIEKVSHLSGRDSKEYASLKKEMDELEDIFSKDIEKALEGMEKLLDRAANIAASLEENLYNEIKTRMEEVASKLEVIKDRVDISPVKNILNKSSDLLESNEPDRSQLLLEKAEAAFEKLDQKARKADAEKELEELKGSMEELKSLSMDVGPVEAVMGEAENALASNEMVKFEEKAGSVKDKLSLLRREKTKVEYQKLLMMIMNGIRDLEDSGIESGDLRERLESIKGDYLSRDIVKCIEAEKVLLEEVRKRRVTLVLKERMNTSMETMEEAEGLLMDIEGPKKDIEKAKALLDEGKYEASLELFTNVQVVLEERMTSRTFSMIEKEIRDLSENGKEYSLELTDIEKPIQEAYSLLDDEKFKEAMEKLYSLRETLEKELNSKKAEKLVQMFSDQIKKARSVGLKIASYKASQTKAKVLLDAGDDPSVIDMMERDLKSIKDEINSKEKMQSTSDELRGKLIGMETKINRMINLGVPVSAYRESISNIKELLETMELEKAQKELVEVEDSINEKISEAMKKKETEKKEAPIEKKEETESSETPPENYKTNIRGLVEEISKEMRIRNTRGEETSAIKKDIETIKDLVIKKEYDRAYKVAKECLERISRG